MSNDTFEPRRVGRPTNAEIAARTALTSPDPTVRQDETRKRRRRREGLGDERNLKLHIPESMKDPGFEYRWVNDRPGRIRQLTVEDDWDVVDTAKMGGDPDPDKNIAEGTVLSRVGDKYTGEKTTLIRKPKDLYAADRKERDDKLKKIEDTMRRAVPPVQGGLGDADNAYIPGGKNIIGGQ